MLLVSYVLKFCTELPALCFSIYPATEWNKLCSFQCFQVRIVIVIDWNMKSKTTTYDWVSLGFYCSLSDGVRGRRPLRLHCWKTPSCTGGPSDVDGIHGGGRSFFFCDLRRLPMIAPFRAHDGHEAMLGSAAA
jgi:hypothetical protein